MDVRFCSELEKIIASEVCALGFDFIGLEFDRHTKPAVLRVYTDIAVKTETNSGGITVDDCGKINYHLNKVLSVTPSIIVDNYVVEVSSPGVERRLFTLLQCEQYLDKKVKLRLSKTGINEKHNVVGILRSVDKLLNRLLVDVDGQNLYFDFNNIARANLVY